MIVLGKVRPGALRLGVHSVALLVALSAVPRAARAQETPPPAGNDTPTATPGPTPGNGAPPAPPTAQPAGPPPSQPSGTTPGQPGSPPPGQAYPPGYGPPPGYAPGYAPPGYSPGYAPPRYAPPMPSEPSHTGTYVHLHVGGGFTSISGSGGNVGTIKLAGSGPAFSVAVGGAPVPNLAVFGSLFFTGASQPKVTSSVYGSAQSTGSAIVGGFGAGIVYYFMPANIYLSAAVAALDFQASDANGKTTYTSDAGAGFEGMIGKEFWVSEHWGLGGALEFVGASSMKDQNTPNFSWSAGAFNLLFSATYF